MSLSNYRLYSVGIVAVSKERDSKEIWVYPTEAIPFMQGEITDAKFRDERTGELPDGQSYTVQLNRGMAVKALWEGTTNRRTSPNVVAGEQVKLYTVGNSDIYFWTPMGRDDGLRRREAVVYNWVASGQGEDTDIDIDQTNSYSVSIDTYDQHITLQTSMDNGEYCTYTVQMDLSNGSFTILDSEENIVQLDTKNTKITMMNKEGTFAALDKKDINMHAPQDMTVEVDRDVKVTVGRDVTYKVGRDVTGNIGRNHTYTVGKDVTGTIQGNQTVDITGNDTLSVTGNVTETVQGAYTATITGAATVNAAATYSVTAGANLSLQAPVVSITGNTTITGTIVLAGALTAGPGPGGGSGAAMFGGPATFQQPVTFSQAVTGTTATFTGGFNGPTWNGTPQAAHLR